MAAFLIGLTFVLAVFAGVVLALRAAERWRNFLAYTWQTAAAELGLGLTAPAEYDRTLQGVLDGVPVRAELKYVLHGKTHAFRVTMCAGAPGCIPPSLVVRGDSFGRSMQRLVDGRDEQIGDPPFDELVEMPALDARGCAALSSTARQQLTRLVQLGGEVRDGVVAFDQLWQDEYNAVWLAQMLRGLSQLTASLSVTPESLYQRLAQNAVHDPLPGVRLQNLRFLADSSTAAPEALRVSVGLALLADPQPSVRLLAAQLVGARGHGVLAALAADPQLAIQRRVLAVAALGRPPAPALDELRALLDSDRPPELLCEALSVVAERGLQPLADAALGCTWSQHDSVRAAAANALGALVYAPAELVLVARLTDDSTEVQRASAEALGALGSVAAVEPLLPLAESLARPQVRRAARAAIGRIQSRLVGVEAGRLSLAEDHELAGALQLADHSAARIGDLSLADDLESNEASSQASAAPGKRATASSAKPR